MLPKRDTLSRCRSEKRTRKVNLSNLCAQSQMYYQNVSAALKWSSLIVWSLKVTKMFFGVLEATEVLTGCRDSGAPLAQSTAFPLSRAAASCLANRTFWPNLIRWVPPLSLLRFFHSRWCHWGASWDPCALHLCTPPPLPSNLNPSGSWIAVICLVRWHSFSQLTPQDAEVSSWGLLPSE